MTNFSKCLYDLIDNADIAAKDERIQQNMEKFRVGADDAVALDNMLIATSRTVCRIVGHKIDGIRRTCRGTPYGCLPEASQ